MHDWIRYILYTGADEHANQPVQNRTTRRPLLQGGSSWTTDPATAVPAQKTGIQPCTPQLRSLWFTLFPKAHPRACWIAAKARRQPHQPQLQDRSVSCPVLWLISKQRSTVKKIKNSWRKRRASRRNSVRKYWLTTLSTAAITRLPERKSFSSTAGNREWFGTTYSSHYSTGGNDEDFSCFKSQH